MTKWQAMSPYAMLVTRPLNCYCLKEVRIVQTSVKEIHYDRSCLLVGYITVWAHGKYGELPSAWLPIVILTHLTKGCSLLNDTLNNACPWECKFEWHWCLDKESRHFSGSSILPWRNNL